MHSWLGPHSRSGRFVSFYLVLAIPLLRLLIQARYELWRPEVAGSLLLLALPCAALASVPGGLPVFLGLLTLWASFFAATSLQIQIAPALPWALYFAALAMLLSAAAMLFRQRLGLLMAIYLGGMVGAEAGLALVAGERGEPVAAPPKNPPPAHTIHLILDEQTGIAGFPPQIGACEDAARLWQEVLLRHGFTVFPNAFSNYASTWSSIPSLVNDRLLESDGQFRLRYSLQRNQLFAKAAARGLDLAVYQSGYLRFTDDDRYRFRLVREYDHNDVSALMATPDSWPQRTRHLLIWYFMLDRPFTGILRQRFPGLTLGVRVGPLAVRKIWPHRIVQDIVRAGRPTLFFAHLLTPHHLYVYDAAGRVRPSAEWGGPLANSDAEYVAQYRDYCRQSAFLAHQMDDFLGELRKAHILDAAKLVIHGDHGARLRSGGSRAQGEDPSRELPEQPSLRDLLDSFSAMLAVRSPGASQGLVDPTKGSILTLLWRLEGRGEAAADSAFNKVYETSDDAILRSIPILRFWKE